MPPAPPSARITDPRQETEQPRASGLIEPDGPARRTAGGARGQHRPGRAGRRLPCPGRLAVPRCRPGERGGQFRRHAGRQPRRDQRRQDAGQARRQLRRHKSHGAGSITAGSTSGTAGQCPGEPGIGDDRAAGTSTPATTRHRHPNDHQRPCLPFNDRHERSPGPPARPLTVTHHPAAQPHRNTPAPRT